MHGSRNTGGGGAQAPVPVYKGLSFRNCRLGASGRTVPGGWTGQLHLYSLWGAVPLPSRPSKVLTR